MAVPKRDVPQEQYNSLEEFERGLEEALDIAEVAPELLPGRQATTGGNPINLGPRVPEADEWAEDMVRNAQNNAEKWLRKVTRPKKDPIEAAKAAAGKWKNNLQQAIAENRYQKGLDQVDHDEMYEIIREGGAEAFAGGVARRSKKIRRKIGQLREHVLALATEIDKMPQDTEAQRDARVLAAVRGMRAIGKRLKGIK